MSFPALRALNPFAKLSDDATSRWVARWGGGAGVILAVLTAWGALALHLDREAFLTAYMANVAMIDHPNPEVSASAMNMGPMLVSVTIGLLFVTAAGLTLGAIIQFRSGGRIPLLLFAAVALWYLHSYLSGLLLNVSISEIQWSNANISFVLNVFFTLFSLIWIITAFRAAMHTKAFRSP